MAGNATHGLPPARQVESSPSLEAASAERKVGGSSKGGANSKRSTHSKTRDKQSEVVAATLRTSPVTVVGIGASAGGLEALSEFFRHVPSKTGVAYMVVQHLSPTHGSILSELLAKQASIPVHEAADGERVDRDHAYVIPPDTKMTLTDGHLKLVPRDPNVRPPLPVDALFRSLAEVQQSRTIGVILSGTGSDGALGVRAIRGVGGITFVQEPGSAGSQGMPRSAIATNCVDVVATPAEIAAQVARLGRHPYLRTPPPLAVEVAETGVGSEPDTQPGAERQKDLLGGGATDPAGSAISDDNVLLVCSLLRRRFGVDFNLYKMGTVERRIRRRMALRRIDSLAEYVDMLRQDAAELGTLYADLLIGVTRFFRDTEVFAILSTSTFAGMLKQRAADRASRAPVGIADDVPFRVWVAGCSTGEEAYSIAICLLELVGAYSPGTAIQIFATDLNPVAIATARAGVYPIGIEADVGPERLRRFFTMEENGYRVARSVRDCCVFAVQNLTTDPPFRRLDVVSCRNVLIYLQPAAHARLLSVFHYALKQNGVLILGTSESVSAGPGLFTPVEKKYRIYARAAGPIRPAYLEIAATQSKRSTRLTEQPTQGDASVETGAAAELAATGTTGPPPVPEIQRAADHVVLGSYAPAAVVVDDDLHIIQFRGRTGAYIEPSAGTASFHLLRMVKPALARDLRRAVKMARDEARPVRVEGVPLDEDGRMRLVTLDVTPFRVAGSSAQFFIISFEEPEAAPADAPTPAGVARSKPAGIARSGPARAKKSAASEPPLARSDDAREIGELRQELEAAQRHIQTISEEHASVIQEFQAANEEIQSSNEELQSTNEEIETSKEELQSLNEELTTLNDELRIRNSDADRLNDDLNNLLSAMQVPVIMVDTDARVRRFTAGAELMVNLIPSDVGRRIGDIKSSVDAGSMEDLIAGVIRTLQTCEREVRGRDGHWYMMTIRPYRTSGSKVDGAVIVYNDIDARKRAAEQLDDARRYAEAIVQTVREPLLVLDDHLRGVSANSAYYAMFETLPNATIGHRVFELGNNQWNVPGLRDLLERVVTEGESFDDVEIETDIHLLGHRVMCLNARRIVLDSQGPALVLLAIEDITLRKDAETRLLRASAELAARADELEITSDELRGKTVEAEASNRAKADFLATMSHELRTPLNAIAGYTQLLDMGIRGPVTEAQHVDLARITRSQRHLMGLINEILNFAKLEAGSVRIAESDVSVREVLIGVKEMIAPQMRRKNLEFQVALPDDGNGRPLFVRGDEDKIRQILLNLLTNALKFTATGGSVEVNTVSDDDHVQLRVRDTGIGIASRELASIFEPFVQINPMLTRATDGVGLGLAISRALARAMGGDVSAESVPGTGSTFTLSLRLAKPPAEAVIT